MAATTALRAIGDIIGDHEHTISAAEKMFFIDGVVREALSASKRERIERIIEELVEMSTNDQSMPDYVYDHIGDGVRSLRLALGLGPIDESEGAPVLAVSQLQESFGGML